MYVFCNSFFTELHAGETNWKLMIVVLLFHQILTHLRETSLYFLASWVFVWDKIKAWYYKKLGITNMDVLYCRTVFVDVFLFIKNFFFLVFLYFLSSLQLSFFVVVCFFVLFCFHFYFFHTCGFTKNGLSTLIVCVIIWY